MLTKDAMNTLSTQWEEALKKALETSWDTGNANHKSQKTLKLISNSSGYDFVECGTTAENMRNVMARKEKWSE